MITPIDRLLIEEMDNEDCMLMCAEEHDDAILDQIFESFDPREEIDTLFPIDRYMRDVIYND